MRTRTLFGDLYQRGVSGRGRVALTFDDGPLPGATDRVLDRLKDGGVPAAFFVIGRLAERSPGLIERMHAEGHVVANHTFDHHRWGMWRGPRYWRQQVARCDAAVERIIGRRPALWRPPYGVRTPVNRRVAAHLGHACVTWTCRALDGVRTTTDRIEARLAAAADGDVLLLHDGREPASARDPTPTIDALPRVIAMLRANGLEPTPLDELLAIAAYAEARPLPSPGMAGRG